MSERDRVETGLLIGLWVLPLLATVAFLFAVDLPQIALALLAVELVVGAATVLARRRPERPAGSSRPWLVPLLMVGALVAMVGIAVVASTAG